MLAQSLAFTIGHISKGEDLYDSSHAFLSQIVSWDFLIPIVAVQVLLCLLLILPLLS